MQSCDADTKIDLSALSTPSWFERSLRLRFQRMVLPLDFTDDIALAQQGESTLLCTTKASMVDSPQRALIGLLLIRRHNIGSPFCANERNFDGLILSRVCDFDHRASCCSDICSIPRLIGAGNTVADCVKVSWRRRSHTNFFWQRQTFRPTASTQALKCLLWCKRSFPQVALMCAHCWNGPHARNSSPLIRLD